MEMFDKGQVAERPFYVGEGYSAPGLVVYPDSPEEVEILLDEEGGVMLYRLMQEGSQWATAEGLKIGSTLKALEEANGRPFTFLGFDWDYGGTVTDWKGGKLAEKTSWSPWPTILRLH
ncbi:MAG: hypothetical protein R2795_12665 [Saprospiraceae bacterium]